MKPEDLIKTFNAMIVLVTPINRSKEEVGDKEQRGKGVIGFGEENRAVAARLIEFFEKRDIHPQAYLAGCFAKGSWTYRPSLIQLSNDDYLKWWYDNRDVAFQWWDNIRRELEADEPAALSPAAELIKRRHAWEGKTDLCRASVFTEFNPRSPICKTCPERGACGSR